ncbi:MAG: hypothetical protein HQK65_07530 [Desulfamplus sp.]|nr:hypothetical protein [Desulfamplus sp.]
MWDKENNNKTKRRVVMDLIGKESPALNKSISESISEDSATIPPTWNNFLKRLIPGEKARRELQQLLSKSINVSGIVACNVHHKICF